ncbi:MAG TPA: ABC transporter ATP-binding protein [Anaerovoracaceae bacterium]|nr:ABC transporter ATP-binding protein [Anaerovoracaceae bacterium]
MLILDDIITHYGNICALRGISLDVRQGEIVTIIGGNGAGKTTTLKTICNLVSATSGNVYFLDENITNKSTSDIVKTGIVMVPEGRRVFPKMSVLENLQLGAYLNKNRSEVKNDLEKVFDMFPILKDRIKQVSGTLSGGEQQMLAIGRALMANPRLLLLDEPSMGLAPKIVTDIFNIILEINRAGTTILLVEQNARMALSIADKGFVIETGDIVLEDTAENLMRNEEVKRAYLGE